nr:hypothetical protein [Tanacetum cinerariifolium]
WKSRIKRYIDTKPNHELIHYCLKNPPYELGWIDKEIPISKGSPITRSKRFQETYKNVSQEIRDQLNGEAEAVQIILTGIDNDIYSTVDACPNACEMWKEIKRLKQESKAKDCLISQLYDILKQHQHEVNEIRAERIARVANPLAVVAQQQPVYHPQTHPTHYTQNSSTRSQQATTRNKGKSIINFLQPTYDQEPSMVAGDDETSKDNEVDKLMALISLSFNKIYKPTNNNLRTSSNTSRANQDNSPRINKSAGYENQRIGNVAGARETVGSTAVQKSGIQCYNCKEFRHVARECQKPKRAKDVAYHREKMLLCKKEEAGIQIDNDIYSTVDACPNACEMWKAIERNQCKVTNHQVNVQFLLQLQQEWQRSQQAATRNSGKAIVNSPQPIYDQEPSMVAEDDEMSKDKEIDKLIALISLLFKKIYKPTNNNLLTSSNFSRANQDNSLRINRSAGIKIKGLAPQDYNASFAVPCLFIHSSYIISLSLYPFTERYAQPYFISCLIRQMVNTCTDAELSAAVQNALQTLLPQIRAKIREEFRTSSGPSDSGENPPLVTIHTWLERFNKQKPRSFKKATAPVDAENWISHMEKIFDVMGCDDAFKTRLAVYKFKGNALAWWNAYKQAKGGDAWLITVTWAEFKKFFFLQFFPRAEQECLKRDYHSIRQTNTVTSTEFMQHFLRLAGFLGAAAGTTKEQAKNFQWGLRRSTLNHLMCMPFTDVAQVANAARNYEILHERDDDDAERPDKRQKSGDQHQPTTQQSSHRNHGHNNDRHRSDRLFLITYIPSSSRLQCFFRCAMLIYSYFREALQIWYQSRRFRPVGYKDLTCEDWMVNTRTDAELSAAVQNALQKLFPQIRAKISDEFRTSSGPSNSGGNPPPVTIHTWLERFNKQKPRSFKKATAPVDAENWISHMEKIFDV